MRVTITERLTQNNFSEQLVRACRDNAPEAQRELYEHYKAKVYSLAIYMTGDVELAGDLTQEIFLKVFRDLPTFRFECNFGTWLYRLAVNTCLNALRKHRKHVEIDLEDMEHQRKYLKTNHWTRN